MAMAEITYGTPVNLTVGDEVFLDLGAEQQPDGQHVIRMTVDDGSGFAQMAITAEQAELLADTLLALAHITSSG